jgi:hypothetical protein
MHKNKRTKNNEITKNNKITKKQREKPKKERTKKVIAKSRKEKKTKTMKTMKNNICKKGMTDEVYKYYKYTEFFKNSNKKL